MSGLDPKGPSQPTLSQAYETEGNPADQNSAEKASAETQAQENSGEAVEHRVPEKQSTYETPQSIMGFWRSQTASDLFLPHPTC